MSEIPLKRQAAPREYLVGACRIDTVNARLTRSGEIVPLTVKAFDTLRVLVESAGRLVTKDELLERVWPDVAVDENNLTQQISTLRKALGPDAGWIETVPRRGYRFIGEVRPLTVPTSPALETRTAVATTSAGAHWRRPMVAAMLAVAALGGVGTAWFTVGRASGSDPGVRAAAATQRAAEFRRAGNADGAVAELRAAIRLDPTNAMTYGELAHALNAQSAGLISSAVRPRGASPSVEAARRGVELAPDCAACLGTLALFTFYHDWEFAEGERLFRDAIRLGPQIASIRPAYAMLLSVTGRPEEAISQAEIGLGEDPYQPSWLQIRMAALYYARRYDEAVAAADRILAIKTHDRAAWDFRSKALFQLGRGEDALHALAQEMFASRSVELEQGVRQGGVEGGLRKLLEFTDDWRSRIEYSWRRAAWRAQLGEADGAIDELERAYQTRRLNAINFGADPVYDGIREHPRFRRLLSEIGLGPYFGVDPVLVSAR